MSPPSRLELLPLGDQLGAAGGVLLAAGRLGHLVLAAAEVFHLRQHAFPLGVERDHAVDLGDDLGPDVPVDAVLLHEVDVGDHEFEVEHAKSSGWESFQGLEQRMSPTAIGPRIGG